SRAGHPRSSPAPTLAIHTRRAAALNCARVEIVARCNRKAKLPTNRAARSAGLNQKHKGGMAMKIIGGLQCILLAGLFVLATGEVLPAETRLGGGPLPAITDQVLYSFCPSAALCTDGAHPGAGLIMDGACNLYGTTLNGGGT